MDLSLVVFEDSGWRKLRPIADTVVVPAMQFGDGTVTDRWMRVSGLPLTRVVARSRQMRCWNAAPRPTDAAREVVLVNAAALPGPWFKAVISGGAARWVAEGRTLAARAPWNAVKGAVETGPEALEEALTTLREIPVEGAPRLLSHPWSPILWNADALTEDLSGPLARVGTIDPRAILINAERIRVDSGARVDPGAVLDARLGPIHIGPGALVVPHTVVIGPCSVGAGTQLLGGIVSRSTFGPECRVAGEVEECVWQGYSSKRHHGFVGHSWIGEWVNLGALTTTSDLKNNYGAVRVHEDGIEVESGQTKIGSILGAHVKTGIGTLLPTGAVVGTGANLFGGGLFAPRNTPSFAWWDGERMEEHRYDKFLETARVAMSRRGRTLGPAEEVLANAVFEETRSERAPAPAAGKKGKKNRR